MTPPAPTSSDSGRSTRCPGAPKVSSVAPSAVAVTVKSAGTSISPLSDRLSVIAFAPLGIDCPVEALLKVD